MRPLLTVVLVVALAAPVFAQQKSDGRQLPAQRRTLVPRPEPVRPQPIAASTYYVNTSPEYRHVQIRQRPTASRTKLDIREITQVMTTPALDAYRFQQPRITQIETIIRLLDNGETDRAIRTWGGFVASLRDRADPVNIDNLIHYIARESCFGRNPAARFHAQRLAHLQQAQDDTRFYLAQCEANLRNLGRFQSTPEVRNELEIEIARAAADLQILEIRERQALENYNNIRARNDRYERQFITLADAMYNEACQRVQLQPRRGIRRP